MEYNTFQYNKRNSVSPSGHVKFYLLHVYKHQKNTKPFHLQRKAQFIFLAIVMPIFLHVIFSHVVISSFHVRAHLVHVFHWWLYNKLVHYMIKSLLQLDMR